MRVVVYTNVLVSAALKDESLPALAVRLIERRHTMLKSVTTEQEMLQVVARPQLARLIALPFYEWLSRMLKAAEPVAIAETIAACRDPKDDKFLELAITVRRRSLYRVIPICSRSTRSGEFPSSRRLPSCNGRCGSGDREPRRLAKATRARASLPRSCGPWSRVASRRG
jgi:uncharacterized protein